jgi:hypothetical protein
MVDCVVESSSQLGMFKFVRWASFGLKVEIPEEFKVICNFV